MGLNKIMLIDKRRYSDFKNGIHYEIRDIMGEGYYFCLSCQRYFPKTYNSNRSAFIKQYGTRQLMALWAWYNFERHLKKCHKPTEVIEEEKEEVNNE